MTTLQQHISRLVHNVLDRYPGSWMTWCDPRGDWGPLLQRVSELDGSQGFTLVSVTEQTAGEIGSPGSRRALQERMDAKESFVLHVTTTADHLGWLWAQALLRNRRPEEAEFLLTSAIDRFPDDPYTIWQWALSASRREDWA